MSRPTNHRPRRRVYHRRRGDHYRLPVDEWESQLLDRVWAMHHADQEGDQ